MLLDYPELLICQFLLTLEYQKRCPVLKSVYGTCLFCICENLKNLSTRSADLSLTKKYSYWNPKFQRSHYILEAFLHLQLCYSVRFFSIALGISDAKCPLTACRGFTIIHAIH